MAVLSERWEDNAAGKYYVDKNCIMCDVCCDIAPELFTESEDGDHHILAKQPSTMSEEEAVRDAMDQCPVEAIGDDGLD
ncbi:MAG: ferredoxin [Candidatus Omnitrophica bacterium]|nr:ferredoxin [Candidatus Omnitrophota bacterium]